METILEIKHLSKSFNNLKVLDDVNLKVNKGDIYGVLGLSGAGKSTLVRCINGLEEFDAGEIYFKNELLSSSFKSISKENRQKIAMIFQQFNLLEQKTAFDNVKLALDISKKHFSKKEKEELCLNALKKVDMLEKKDFYPSQLSGGQKQRIAIARALVLNPDILLSDEATSSLDPKTTSAILNLLHSLNKELGLTIIMISHQMNTIEAICNKVAIIDNSKVVEDGLLSDVFLNPKSNITKKLIYANHVNTPLEDNKFIRILFNGNVDEPLISNIVQDCQISVSIYYASSKVVDNKVYGQTVIRVPKGDKDRMKLYKYLKVHNVEFEEVN